MDRTLRACLFAALFVSLPSQLALVVEDPGTYPYIAAARRQSPMVRQAMRYHGTRAAFGDGRDWYFRDRGGTICRLFTRGCRWSLAQRQTPDAHQGRHKG